MEVDNGLIAVHCAHGLNRWAVCLSFKIADYFCLIGWNSSLTISRKILLADENDSRVSKFFCQDRLLDLSISDSKVWRWTKRSGEHVIQLETRTFSNAFFYMGTLNNTVLLLEQVTRFNEARGFPMKRQTLIDHLFSRCFLFLLKENNHCYISWEKYTKTWSKKNKVYLSKSITEIQL